MKLIISQLEALRSYVSREFSDVIQHLITDYDWRQVEMFALWNRPGSLRQKLLDEFGELPETVLFWHGYEFLNAHANETCRLNARKIVFADDLHWWNESMRREKLVSFALCDRVLSTYDYVWDKFYPELRNIKEVVWVPHSASRDFMLSYNHCPENSILLSGAMTYHYPLRRLMKTLHDRRVYAIAYHPHPGYHCEYDYENDSDVGRGYAEKFNKHRVGFTDSLIYGYVVAKYFEIPATGALLLAERTVAGPLSELGFMEDQHYVSVTKDDLEEKIRYVLDEKNHDELDRIRRSGQELVWERHKTSDRAAQIDAACAA
jgi:hypothetical protein